MYSRVANCHYVDGKIEEWMFDIIVGRTLSIANKKVQNFKDIVLKHSDALE